MACLLSSIFARLFYIILFLVLLPLLLFLCLLVLFLDGRPVLFKQQRIGLNEKLFVLYKFRTMAINSHIIKDGFAVSSNDKRISKLGHYMRKFSLDELPQVFNLVRGELSFVGPRLCFLNNYPISLHCIVCAFLSSQVL